MIVELLSGAYARLGHSVRALRLMHSLRLHWLERLWLSSTVLRRDRSQPDDITVLIGVRNRVDHRVINALRSIREQTYAADLVRIIVIDYGSEPANARSTGDLCRRYAAEYVNVDHAPIWSRSRCLNVGIRRATTKFVMTSDVDVILSKHYLADAICALARAPLSVVYAPMLDLTEESIGAFRRMAETHARLDVESWKEQCSPRFGLPFHPSVAVTRTAFLQLIRGYDEFYELWGCEDDDLLRRLGYLGLEAKILEGGSFYLHQWHPKFEGLPEGERAEHIRRNRAHLECNHAILRNDRGWGRTSRDGAD